MFLRKKKKFGLGSPSSKVDYFGKTQSNSLGKNEESRRMNDCLFLPFLGGSVSFNDKSSGANQSML